MNRNFDQTDQSRARSRSSQSRSPSPDQFRIARTWKNMGDEFGLKNNPEFPLNPLDGSSSILSTLSRPSTRSEIGHFSDDRIKKRAERTSSPVNDEAVVEILKKPPSRHRSPDINRPLSRNYPLSKPSSATSMALESLDRVPNARLGIEVPIGDKSTLGSSQVLGCQGDFCDYNISSINDFQMTKKASENSYGRRRKPTKGFDYQHSLMQSGVLDSSNESKAPTHTISYHSIIQARQEMPLVKLQLERHIKGDDGPYVMQDTYKDLALGGKLPAHYYQDVPCCENCYRVYTIINEARSKAIKQITKNIDAKKQKKSNKHVKDEVEDEESEFTDEQDAKDYLESNFTKFQLAQLNTISTTTKRRNRSPDLMNQDLEFDMKKPKQDENYQAALKAIESLTKSDVAEIRSMVKPPAAVEVVIEAVMILLTGKYMTFKESYRLLSGGEAFLVLLKDFSLETVTDERLKLIEAYVDNPLFRPENVAPVSYCASKFCAWVHGIVHAARYQRGMTHKRIDTIKQPIKPSPSNEPNTKSYLQPLKKPTGPNRLTPGSSSLISKSLTSSLGSAEEELTFVQKLEKMKANKVKEIPRNLISREDALGPIGKGTKGGKVLSKSSQLKHSQSFTKQQLEAVEGSLLEEPSQNTLAQSQDRTMFSRSTSKFDPGPSPSLMEMSITSYEGQNEVKPAKSKLNKREAKAVKAMQKKSINRLAAQTSMEGSIGAIGVPKEFRCADGISRMPYVVMGKFSLDVEKCNFIIIHDFFDTYDATAILFKPIIQRHDDGCQILCFNYPGQAHTVWPRPSQAERDRGAKDVILNNDWIADRVHELLAHAEEEGDILLSKPFHLVGIGNGCAIAGSFIQKYGDHPLYVNSLRSFVSINGFLYPDPQLSSILHAAYQVFESTPHTRPDIAVSYWSRFIFSDEYLRKVNPNLALNIYTAVSNPITNEGRVRITRGCLSHRDLRGALSPDVRSLNKSIGQTDPFQQRFKAIQVPVIVLQSTEDTLINASNVDSFLVGRSSKHLWSHMLNVPSEALMSQAFDVNAQWVGRMSTSPDNYAKYSTLGKQGIQMVLDCLGNPRGAFVMWARSGHIVQQEYKAALLDLIDILACPVEEYAGLNLPEETTTEVATFGQVEEIKELPPRTNELVLKLQVAEAKVEIEPPQVIFDASSISSEAKTIDEIPTLPPVNIDNVIANIFDGVTNKEPVNKVEPEKLEELEDENEIIIKSLENNSKNAPIENVNLSNEKISSVPLSPSPIHPTNIEELIDSPKTTPLPVVPVIVPDEVFVSSSTQRSKQEWSSKIPNEVEAMKLENELRQKQLEYLQLEAKLKELRNENSSNSQQEGDDWSRLQELSDELVTKQMEKQFTEKQRELEMEELEEKLLKEGLITENDVLKNTVKEMPPMNYSEPHELPRAMTEGRDIVSKLDQMLRDEEEARRRGVMSMEEFEQVKAQMLERQLERDQKLRALSEDELQLLNEECSIQISRIIRGFLGRRRYKRLDKMRQIEREQRRRILQIQKVVRGFLGRRKYKRIRAIYLSNIKGKYSATQIQRLYRGHADRQYFRKLKQWYSVMRMQRLFRGFLGRKAVEREKQRLKLLKLKQMSATKIQSTWRMKIAKEEYRNLRIHILAAIEVQRVFRGYLGRKRMARKKLWDTTKPGPERIKLGLTFIEESKQAFERQQEEIDALHRAQERAEARISHIHAELKDSEKELVVLERELQEIDAIERDLQILSHEKQLLTAGIDDAAGMPRTAKGHHKEIVQGKESNNVNDPMLERRKRAEAYALEMTIQLKRAEREKKRQELEIEFANVFQEVEKKKKALSRLETSLADMEATRERKDREFKRLQKNLMQLLLEQKKELDDLREKGLELETATATTAAAAIATAQKAKEHEQRSNAMFSQTEELMKFQFMSMSLSYFSSLNMLKSLRDMNADTTSAAIALSADASATAASVANAANLPNVKKMQLGTNDFVEASIRKKQAEIQVAEKAKKDLEAVKASPLPDNVRTWTVADVARWLETLSLSQYIDSFTEGSVDGPFLMELREEDLVQVLNIRHKLHVRKIIISREKLKPLSQQELKQKEFVENEERADQSRNDMGVPSLDTVFSQARNGRVKRVEESLNLGFPIDSEDERGNTLLLIAAQNSNKRLIEMLLLRGASINHQNAQGNSALHYAISFDKDGTLGEYLIEHGADDTLENIDGLTPYDGVGH